MKGTPWLEFQSIFTVPYVSFASPTYAINYNFLLIKGRRYQPYGFPYAAYSR